MPLAYPAPWCLAAAALAIAPATAQAPTHRSATVQAPTHRSATAGLVGLYDGRQTEVAAGLELRADGRFRYGLTYGALDEEAEGRWSVAGGHVLLTSDPVVAPRFALLGRSDGPAGRLRVMLEVPGDLSRQYFHAEVRLADGSTVDRQLGEEDGQPIDLPPGARAVAVTLLLPVAELRGETIDLGRSHDVRFRFEPHDLGKVSFARTPLRIERGDLLLARHDLMLRFRRTGP